MLRRIYTHLELESNPQRELEIGYGHFFPFIRAAAAAAITSTNRALSSSMGETRRSDDRVQSSSCGSGRLGSGKWLDGAGEGESGATRALYSLQGYMAPCSVYKYRYTGASPKHHSL